MSIQLDTTRLAGSIQMSAPDLPAPSEQGKALAALLGGKSLTVTDGSMTDLEALVAKLKSDSERTRFLMLMTSLTSIGQSLDAAQKSALAVLDKENDKDMRTRIRLTPLIYLGPIAFVPMVIVGVLLDMLLFKNTNAYCGIIFTVIGLVFYLLSFIMAILVLKTEKKAQKRAYEIMKDEGLATKEELEMCKKLFRLYNIEYINDMVIALLELIYRVLQIIAYVQNSSSSSSKQ